MLEDERSELFEQRIALREREVFKVGRRDLTGIGAENNEATGVVDAEG